MDSLNAIKFLDSYDKQDRPIYFGRDKEIQIIYEKVKKARVVVLYGLSGTGKTSLVQCGLANEFSDSEWMEIIIRRGGYVSIMEAISAKIITLSKNINYVGPVLKEPLWQIYLENLKPIYLIFDQFEELFINGDEKEIKKMVSFISDVIHDGNLPVTVIFSLREEYFAHLDKFEKKVPTIYDNKLRLERMSSGTLEEVIEKISKQNNFELDDGVAKIIIANIENKQTQSVDLPYLQVYLHKFFSRISGETKKQLPDEKRILTADDVKKVGKLEDVLSDFLEEQVQLISKEHDILQKTIWDVLKCLITYEGTKKSISQQQLEELLIKSGYSRDEVTAQKISGILNELLKKQIIQRNGERFFELRHDILGQKIHSKRTADEKFVIDAFYTLKNIKDTKGLLTEDQINKIRPYTAGLKNVVSDENEYNDLKLFFEDNVNAIRKRKAREKTQQNFIKGLAVLLGMGILFIFYLVWSSQTDDYKKLLEDAKEAQSRGEYGSSVNFYQQALHKPWFIRRNADSIAKKIQSVTELDSIDKVANMLFDKAEISAENLDSAYIYYDLAYRYKPTEVYKVKKDNAKDRIENRIRELDEAIALFNKTGSIGEKYSVDYKQERDRLGKLINK